jgi:hypothetical protein
MTECYGVTPFRMGQSSATLAESLAGIRTSLEHAPGGSDCASSASLASSILLIKRDRPARQFTSTLWALALPRVDLGRVDDRADGGLESDNLIWVFCVIGDRSLEATERGPDFGR